jgi:hypothetical protein
VTDGRCFCSRDRRKSLSFSPPKGSVDACFAEVRAPHDLGHPGARLPKQSDLGGTLWRDLEFSPELDAPLFRFGNAVHLPLPPDVVFELSEQREDTHHELTGAGGRVDIRVISDLEGDALLAELRDDAVKVRSGAGQAIDLGHEESVTLS